MPSAITATNPHVNDIVELMSLTDPAFTVPPPGPSGPIGTMPWLRATVSRFAEGETHTRRRALVVGMLDQLDPASLRHAAGAAVAETRPVDDALPYIPVAVLATALGIASSNTAIAVDDVRVVASAYHPGTDASGADDALARLLTLLSPAEPEVAAQQIALLVQACEATATLIRASLTRPVDAVLADDPPVRTTRRVAPDGTIVAVDLSGHPFGAGTRACPGEAHARALTEGVLEGAR